MRFLLENEQYFDLYANTFLRNYRNSYPDKTDPRAIDWLFVLHTLNFSLSNPKNTSQWTVQGKKGYAALSMAIKRAIDVSTMFIYF